MTAVDRVAEALAAARASGDRDFVQAVNHDINVAMMDFDAIIAKYHLGDSDIPAGIIR